MLSVRRLILFAGVPCSGKSTILDALQKGKLPVLAEQMSLGDVGAWEFVAARRLHRLPDAPVDNMLLHYDILRQWKDTQFDEGYEQDEPLALMDRAAELCTITLWTPAEELLRRAESRRSAWREWLDRWTGGGVSNRTRITLSLCRLYAEPEELMGCYRRWLRFCSRYSRAAHSILDTTDWPPRLMALDEWAAQTGVDIREP